MILLITIIYFLEIIIYIVIADIIISWLALFGMKFRPKIIENIIDPLYNFIKKYIPTNIGPIDLTPIIVILLIKFIMGALIITFPELRNEIINNNI